MKKLTFLLLALLIISSACKKEEKEETPANIVLKPTASQKGFAMEYTATWCHPCGEWGSPLIHQYASKAPNGAIITVHESGDPMYNDILEFSLTTNRPFNSGIPFFWVGDTADADEIDAMVDLLATGNAVAGVDISYTKSGNTMTVKTKTEFFSDAQGDYNLSVLVLEDGIDGYSAGEYKQEGSHSDSYTHDFVLRASASEYDAFGELISSNPKKD